MLAMFQTPWQTELRNRSRAAVSDVNSLARHQFLQPNLAGMLDHIIDKQVLNVAVLEPALRSGKPAAMQNTLDVKIPFAGDFRSFEFAPSNKTIYMADCRVDYGALFLTVYHDDKVDSVVDKFVADTTAILDALRKEVATSRSEIAKAVKEAADRIREQVTAERERDKKISFPIHRN